jgi:hypothetical protein
MWVHVPRRTTWDGLMTQPRTWALSKTETNCGRERPKNPTASAVWSVKENVNENKYDENDPSMAPLPPLYKLWMVNFESGKMKKIHIQIP